MQETAPRQYRPTCFFQHTAEHPSRTRIHVQTHPFIHAILVTWMNFHTQKQTHTHTDTNTQASSHTYCLMCNLFSHAICTQMHVGTICVIWTYTLSMWVHITSHGFFALKSHITSFAARLWMKPGAILVVMCRLGLTGILWSKIWFQVKSGCRVQVQVKFRTNEMFALF